MTDGDNATWKLIIGILLIVVLIAAVVVILVTGTSDDKDKEEGGKTPPNNANEGVHNQQGNDPGGSTGTQITVTGADGSEIATLTVDVGQTAQLTAAVTPDTVKDVPVWTTSDEAVAKVEADETGLKATVTGAAAGTATVTVTVGEAKVDIPVTCGSSGTPGGQENPGGPTPAVVASSISVASQFSKGKAISDVSMNVGQSFTYTALVTPSNATSPVTWSCTNSEGLQIVPTDETGVKAKITCVGAVGNVTVTATIDGVSYDFLIRCRK